MMTTLNNNNNNNDNASFLSEAWIHLHLVHTKSGCAESIVKVSFMVEKSPPTISISYGQILQYL